MRVRVTPPDIIQTGTCPVPGRNTPSLEMQEIQGDIGLDTIPLEDVPKFDDGMPETIDYSNGLALTALSYVAWGVIVIANSYAIVMLCLRAA